MDSNKHPGVEGVVLGALKKVALRAIDECRVAKENEPNEPRFRYQYARAMQTVAPENAEVDRIFKQLVAERYPAAFDNYGWLHIQLYGDYAGAERLFRAGVVLDDADARHSLAQLIIEKRISPSRAGEAVELMREAAEQGNQDALTFLSDYEGNRFPESRKMRNNPQ